MRELLRSTTVYRAIAAGEKFDAALVLFADGKYLRALLKECAKAFFRAADGSRTAKLLDAEMFADCLFFPAEGGKLTAEDCGSIIEESQLAPAEGDKKLFVLDNFHTAAALVQNKLLKILEEPPEGVHFLLGAETESPVLPTVRSRVKKYAVPPFPEEEIARVLQKKYPAADAARAAEASGGVFSEAESLLLGGGEDFALAREFLRLENPEAFCRKTGERKEKKEFFCALKSVLRDMLFTAAGCERFARFEDPASYTVPVLIRALELTSEAEKQILFNANFASCLLTLALGIKEEKEKWQK